MLSYFFINDAMALASYPARGRSSKKPISMLLNSCWIARRECLRSHAASVITGQHENSGAAIPRSASTQAWWYASSRERIATSGPVSTRVRPTPTRLIYSYLLLLLLLLFPKPSKYRRLVLRSFAARRTQPINPAASANSYADPTVASRPGNRSEEHTSE